MHFNTDRLFSRVWRCSELRMLPEKRMILIVRFKSSESAPTLTRNWLPLISGINKSTKMTAGMRKASVICLASIFFKCFSASTPFTNTRILAATCPRSSTFLLMRLSRRLYPVVFALNGSASLSVFPSGGKQFEKVSQN